MSAFRWCWPSPRRAFASTSTTSIATCSRRCKSGRLPFIEHGGEALLAQGARAGPPGVHVRAGGDFPPRARSSSPSARRSTSSSIPSRKVVQDCIDALLPHLADGQLLVLRSTVFPGTTDWLDGYLKRKGRELKVAFCPERVVQGHGIKELKETPQIVSGTTPAAEEEAAKLFSAIAPELVVVTPREAEFAKLFNNAYRYIEFATANQFYLIAKSAGVDYRRVYDAMKRNYPRARGIPSPGPRGRSVPDQGHDAACRLRAEPVQPRQRGHAGQRGPGAPHLRRPAPALRPLAHDGRAARHGVQGRDRRYPRLAQLQVQEGAREPRRRRC